MIVSAATMGSRVLGLVREQVFAALLGSGLYADAFVVAFRIPNLLRDLFAEGALSAAFVPTFSKIEREEGVARAHAAANAVLGALTWVLGVITALGIVFAEPLVSRMAAGFAVEPEKLAVTVDLTRWMMPFLPIVSFAAVTMGMLNARKRFATPALAPALFNVAAILVGGGLWLADADPRTAVTGWAIGTLLGGLSQLVVQFPPLWQAGWRFRPSLWPWSEPAVGRLVTLMAPAIVGLAATQVNILVNTWFASGEAGANAWLSYAFRVMYLPIGVFGVAVATVTQSTLASRAAAKDGEGLAAGLGLGLRHVALLTVPSTFGLLVLAEPVMSLLYEGGRFSATDSAASAVALSGYAVGLYAYSAVKVVAPAFYALERPRMPVLASAAAVTVNLVLNFSLHDRLGYLGLALGTSLGAIANVAVLVFAFRHVTGRGIPGGVGDQLVRVGLAGLAMAGAVWAVQAGLVEALPLSGKLARLAQVSVGVGLGAVVYTLVCRALGVGEVDTLIGVVRRRLRR